MNYHHELLDSGQLHQKCPPSKLFSVRVLVAFLSLLGTAIMYITRVNLNIAILAMVPNEQPITEAPLSLLNVSSNESFKWTTNSSSSPLIVNQSYQISSNVPTAEFNWTPPEQGVILGSFFYGKFVQIYCFIACFVIYYILFSQDILQLK